MTRGVFNDWKPIETNETNFCCWKCKSTNVMYRIWESSCGGYEDYNYKCLDCKHDWWVDGIDS